MATLYWRSHESTHHNVLIWSSTDRGRYHSWLDAYAREVNMTEYTEPPTRNYHREIAEERDRLRTQLQNVITAWEALPGGHYSPGRIERWLVDDMKPAIDTARASIPKASRPTINAGPQKDFHYLANDRECKKLKDALDRSVTLTMCLTLYDRWVEHNKDVPHGSRVLAKQMCEDRKNQLSQRVDREK